MNTKEQISIKGTSHFGIVKDIEKTVHRFWSDLGIGPWGLFTFGAPTPLRAHIHGKPADLTIKAAGAQLGSMSIGLDYALTSPGPYDDIIAKRGGGAHHLCFIVDDLKKAEAQMEAFGYSAILSGHGWGVDGDGGGSYFETTENMGTVIEFMQPPHAMPPGDGMFPPEGQQLTGGDVGIRGPSHLAIAVRDVEKAAAHFQEELGIGPWPMQTYGEEAGTGVYHGKEVFLSQKVVTSDIGPYKLALVQPLSSPNPVQDWLDQNGQGIHHVGFVVDELELSAAKMKELGYDEVFTAHGLGPNKGGKVSYFDTEEALGIVIELVQTATGT